MKRWLGLILVAAAVLLPAATSTVDAVRMFAHPLGSI